MLPEHLSYPTYKDLSLLPRIGAQHTLLFLQTEKDLTFRYERANAGCECGNARCCPEEHAPAMVSPRDEEQIQYGRDEVPDCVSLLEHARGEPARFDGEIFERGGGR